MFVRNRSNLGWAEVFFHGCRAKIEASNATAKPLQEHE